MGCSIARCIDASCVGPATRKSALDQLVEASEKYNFICAFTMPCFTAELVERLRGKETLVGGAVGFPSGADTTAIKVASAKEMLKMGCDELDTVINVGALLDGDFEYVKNDFRAVVEAAEGIPVKSILEVTKLDDYSICKASEICAKAGAAYIKTGTGWMTEPTTIRHVKLIKDTVGDAVKIKVAGGVRSLETLLEMMDAGSCRFGIGLQSAIKIAEEAIARGL